MPKDTLECWIAWKFAFRWPKSCRSREYWSAASYAAVAA